MIKSILSYLETIPVKINVQRVLLIFRLVLVLFYLCLGVSYWIRLIGVYPGDLWRFDLMPWNWRVLCCVLAVAYPVAACGLWQGARWGLIVWCAGMAFETLCLTVYASHFVWNLWLPLLHLGFLLVYAAMSALLFLYRRQLETSDVLVDY